MSEPASPPRPPLPAFVHGGWTDLQEFTGWAEANPFEFRDWETVLLYLEAGDDAGLTPQMRADAPRFVLFRKQLMASRAVTALSRELRELLQAPIRPQVETERKRRLLALLKKISASVEELPEPDRSDFLPRIAGFREALGRGLRRKGR